MQPGPSKTTVCQRDEDTDGSEVGVSFGLIGRAICESTDSGILVVDEVDEIRVTIVEARGQRLVLDDAIEFDCIHISACTPDATMRADDIPSEIARFHAIV